MSPIKLFSRYGELIFELSKREIIDKYAGQFAGAIWALLHPLFLMVVYITVFGVIFGLRFDHQMPLNYGAYLLAGLIPWLAVVDVLTKSSVVITCNSALIKQVVFPIEVLPAKGVVSTIFNQLIFWGFYLIYALYKQGQADVMWLFLPVLIVGQVIFLLGVSFFVSSIATIVRDIKDVIQMLAIIGLYFLPIIYLPNMLPSWMESLLRYNPLSHMIWVFQDVVFYGEIKHPVSWYIWLVTIISVYILGAVVFEKLKLLLANYL